MHQSTAPFSNIDVLLRALDEPHTSPEDARLYARAILGALRHLAGGVLQRIDSLSKGLPS